MRTDEAQDGLIPGQAGADDNGFAAPARHPDSRSSMPRLPAFGRQYHHLALRWIGAALHLPGTVLARSPGWIAEERAFGHGFLFLPLLLALGALWWFSLARPPHLAILAVLLCVFGVSAWQLRHRAGVVPLLVIAASAVLAGMVAAAVETARIDPVLLDSAVTTTVTAEVISREVAGVGAWRYVLAMERTEAPRLRRPPGRVSLLVRGGQAPAPIGARVSARMRLSPPSGPALPGLNDFAFDAYFKSIGAVGYAYGPLSVMSEAKRASSWGGEVRHAIAAAREAIGSRIRAVIGGDAGTIAAALVTGEERAISPEVIEALRLSGLGHVLAISGLNMALAAGILLVGLRVGLSLIPGLAHRLAIKKLAAAGALVMVTLYLLMSGGAVSAIRSYVMIAIMLIAVFLDRPSITLRNVALAALLVLVVEPSAVTGPGFQMSFAATLALVAGYARWRPDRAEGALSAFLPAAAQGFFRAGGAVVLSAAIGGVSTMIYAAAHFHRLPAYGLLGNVLAMPLIMPAALVAMLLMPLGLDGPLLVLLGWGVEGMIAIARFVADLEGEIVTGLVPAPAFLLVAVGGVVACLLRTPLAASGLLLMAGGIAVFCLMPVPHPAILIAEDGRIVALPGSLGTATNRASPPDFIYDQWQRALRLLPHNPPDLRPDLALSELVLPPRPKRVAQAGGGTARPSLPRIDQAAARDGLKHLVSLAREGRFTCVPRQWCVARLSPAALMVTVEDVRLVGLACDVAALVVTPTAPRFAACRSGALLVAAPSLRRSGALMLEADPGSQQGYRRIPSFEGLSRPWQRHRAYDWRSDRFADEDEALDKT